MIDLRLSTIELPRVAVVVLRAVDLPAGLLQVVLEVATLAVVQAAARSAVDALFGANARLVGSQFVQLAFRQLVVLHAVPDSLRLPVLACVDAGRGAPRRLRGRRGCGRKERCSECDGGEVSNEHPGLLLPVGRWRGPLQLSGGLDRTRVRRFN